MLQRQLKSTQPSHSLGIMPLSHFEGRWYHLELVLPLASHMLRVRGKERLHLFLVGYPIDL
jgi:hypothetical protein